MCGICYYGVFKPPRFWFGIIDWVFLEGQTSQVHAAEVGGALNGVFKPLRLNETWLSGVKMN